MFLLNDTTLFIYQGEFLSIELENGNVVFNFYLGEDSFWQLRTEYKYNRNKWVSVAVARSGLIGRVMCSR